MFEIDGPLRDVEVIASGPSIRDLSRLKKAYGQGRWRKLRGLGLLRFKDGRMS